MFFRTVLIFGRGAGVALAAAVAADPASSDEAAIRPGHSHAGEAFSEGPRQRAVRIDGCGAVSFPITTAWEDGQAFFDQGIGQLHGFWYYEAERTFRTIAARDPECAMAYWGMAMANWENESRAREFIEEAADRKENASPRERMWIEAQGGWLSEDGARKDRARSLLRALENISHEHPDDLEAKAFLAVRIWQFRDDLPISSHETVDALLREIFAASPNHPAHHYRIHLWDAEKPERALVSAAENASAAPAIAHMWHMPGHIYWKLKRYDDAAWHQEASARVDHRWMFESGILPDQIHNYAHNSEWLVRSLHRIGAGGEAAALAQSMLDNPRHPKLNRLADDRSSAGYGHTRLIESLETFELWDDLQTECQPDGRLPRAGDRDLDLRRLRALALAACFTDDADALVRLADDVAGMEAAAEVAAAGARAEARSKAMDEEKSEEDAQKAADRAARSHAGFQRRAREAAAEIEVFRAVVDGRSDAARENFSDLKRSDIVRSRLRLRLGDREDAESLAREAVKENPSEVLPLANLADILSAVGKPDEAASTFAELRPLCARADLSPPPLARLAPIADDAGMPSDWRPDPSPRDDIVARPDISSLGPLAWTPPAAPDAVVHGADGADVAIESLGNGQPLLIIFYLGHGCLHCIEQLNVFAPDAENFAAEGIRLAAVSLDAPDELAFSQKMYQSGSVGDPFPFPLFSDPELQAFKAFRAYDEFENIPLHGTFLVSGDGRVLWQDVGPEPFAEAEFLLAEAKRLLRRHPRSPVADAR